MADFEWLTGLTLHSAVGVDRKNQPLFSSLDDQWSWFDQRKFRKLDNMSYQRVERGYIKVNINYEDLLTVDYISFINRNYGYKRFYGRVTEKLYRNANETYIMYEVDSFQTFQFDFTTPKNYVIRQHAVKDWTGKPNLSHVFPEATGGYNTYTEQMTLHQLNTQQGYRIFFTKNTLGKKLLELNEFLGFVKNSDPKVIDGIYSGVCVMDCLDYNSMTDVMAKFDSWGMSDNIIAVWQLPVDMLNSSLPNIAQVIRLKLTNTRTDIEGYNVQNNKSLFYPYKFIRASNYSGKTKIYKYEDFKDPTEICFGMKYTASMFPTVVYIPMDYKGVALNYEEAIEFTNFPMLAVQSNAFSSWFAQNIITVGVQAGAAIATSGASLIGSVGTATEGVSSALEGDRAVKTANGGYLNVALGTQGFLFEQVSIHKEVGEMIDSTFSKYGYLFKSLMDVNYNSRPYWNYVQLQDAHIHGSFADNYKKDIEAMLNEGVTFWKDGNDIGNYDRDNKGV